VEERLQERVLALEREARAQSEALVRTLTVLGLERRPAVKSLDVSRGSGFYPDIFMGYPEPLRQLRRLSVIEPQARFFCKNRGVALLVRKGNPRGIQGLADVTRAGARIALPDSGDVRAQCRAAAEALLPKPAADALLAAEVSSFPGRLGIMHRDLPEMIARGYADVAFTWYHLVSYWARIFPDHFALVAVPGAEPFCTRIAFARVNYPLRARGGEGVRPVLLRPGEGRVSPIRVRTNERR
jgi:hypothetical protein